MLRPRRRKSDNYARSHAPKRPRRFRERSAGSAHIIEERDARFAGIGSGEAPPYIFPAFAFGRLADLWRYGGGTPKKLGTQHEFPRREARELACDKERLIETPLPLAGRMKRYREEGNRRRREPRRERHHPFGEERGKRERGLRDAAVLQRMDEFLRRGIVEARPRDKRHSVGGVAYGAKRRRASRAAHCAHAPWFPRHRLEARVAHGFESGGSGYPRAAHETPRRKEKREYRAADPYAHDFSILPRKRSWSGGSPLIR